MDNAEHKSIVLSEDELFKPPTKILIAEDDCIYRRLLQSRLENWGCQVIAAKNGEEAWKILQEPDAPGLLILDWIMPGISGLDLCRRIREQHTGRYQYILLLTSKDNKQDLIDGLNAGADDYLTKPFDDGELRARLRAGNRILSLQQDLIKAQEILRFDATHDGLTGLWTRSAALHLLGVELQRSERTRSTVGILMIDLDHFKNINDTHGHLAGDEVLKETAYRISQAVRSYDFVGRYGGEEFVAVLGNCTLDDLRTVSERIRSAVSDVPIATRVAKVNATVSIGGVVAASDADHTQLLAAADSALYDAKRNGRNRVMIGSCDQGMVLQETLQSPGLIAHA